MWVLVTYMYAYVIHRNYPYKLKQPWKALRRRTITQSTYT